MTATASYDFREATARIAAIDPRHPKAAAYAGDPEQATIDVLDAEDIAIARLARDRFDRQVAALTWSLAALDRWWRSNPADVRRSWFADAIEERHPNPTRTP